MPTEPRSVWFPCWTMTTLALANLAVVVAASLGCSFLLGAVLRYSGIISFVVDVVLLGVLYLRCFAVSRRGPVSAGRLRRGLTAAVYSFAVCAVYLAVYFPLRSPIVVVRHHLAQLGLWERVVLLGEAKRFAANPEMAPTDSFPMVFATSKPNGDSEPVGKSGSMNTVYFGDREMHYGICVFSSDEALHAYLSDESEYSWKRRWMPVPGAKRAFVFLAYDPYDP